MMMMRQRPTDGRIAASWTRARASATLIDSPSVATTLTSAWVPSSAVRHSTHSPQPPFGHCSAAAKALAAVDRPEPGGPVNSHACVVADGPGEGLDGRLLADEVAPYGHERLSRRWSTRARTAACSDSTGSEASRT